MATTIPKPFEALLAARIPLECCEGAEAVVEMYDQAHFLAGSTTEHIIRCGKCLRAVHPVTVTILQPKQAPPPSLKWKTHYALS